MHVRLYLVPLLGTKRLETLGPRHVRMFLADVARKSSPATAKEAHRVLRTALTAATREELVTRNVASLVEAPKVVSRETTPWTLDETLAFLEEARRDPLYAAFVLAIAMGLRRGEVLGLRWSDVNLDGRVIRISNQVQRIGGELYQDTTKTGKIRPVPLPLICLGRSPLAPAPAGPRGREAGHQAGPGRPRIHHPLRSPRRAAESEPLLLPAHRLGRPPPDPSARRPARLRHPAHRGRRRSSRADGDPRPQPDQHDHGRLHPRRPGHPTRSDQPHGPTPETAARPRLITAEGRSDRPR